MKFDETEATEGREPKKVPLNELPVFTLFIGRTSLAATKNRLGPWLVIPKNGHEKAIVNLGRGRTIRQSLELGRYWTVHPDRQYIIDPIEVENARIRIPQRYLDMLKEG